MEPNGPQKQDEPVTAQVVPPYPPYPYPPYTPPRRSRGRTLMVLFTLLLLMSLGFSFMLNLALLSGQSRAAAGGNLREEFFSNEEFRKGKDKVAIISVEGAILSYSGFVKEQIDQVRADKSIKAVVLRVDSPGGSVSASDYYYHHLSRLRTELGKPIVVSMGSIAASGGYYVAMAAGPEEKTIYAEPTTFTGSIGVMIPHYNLAGLFDKLGIQEDTIVSHELKDMGSFARDMTDQERAIFQQLVDEGFGRFKSIIRDNRPAFQNDGEALEKLATGQIFTAEQAQEGGLIDAIGFIEDAIDRAIELAGLQPDSVQVIRYKRNPTLTSLLLGARSGQPSLGLADLIEMGAPRPYYLATQLPPLVRSGP